MRLSRTRTIVALGLCATAIGFGACTDDFDTFDPPPQQAAGNDAEPEDGSTDANSRDASDGSENTADACVALAPCETTKSGCVATCAASANACLSHCGGQTCKNKCNNAESACTGTCNSTCKGCALACPAICD